MGTRYVRIRQLLLYASRANVVDRALRDCFVTHKQVLAQAVWRCCDVVRQLEREHDDEWLRKHEADKEKAKDAESKTMTPPAPSTPKKKARRASIGFGGLFD